MDVLSDAITAMRTGRPHSGLRRLRTPWSADFPASDGAGFHIVLTGACWFTPVKGHPVMLGPGDAVFLPREPGHRLASVPRREPGTNTDAASASPGSDPEAILLCGSYQLDGSRTHLLWTSLPSFMHFPARIGSATPLRAAIDLLGAELAAAKPGADAMIPALLDALLVCMVRHWIETDAEPHGSGWSSAIRDPALTAALTAMHEAPAKAWTVHELARAAGMARSSFSERFAQTLGQAPIAYLTWWRMTIAAKRLKDTDAPIAAVARQVGYASEFAFAKAFKRELGTAPGAYRRSR